MSNNGGVYTFSKTAANNATADNTVNWQEGQAPSSVNDSARALMASVAKYRDDISGAIVTTGTSVAYIVASNQVFDTLADFHGQVVAFSPHVTNGTGPVTMTVDGFANLPLRSAPNTELLAGTLVAGTPYVVTYNNTDGALYLHGFYNDPYNVPFLGGMDYWDTVTPNSAFIFPNHQAISRTVYSRAFARWGTTFGAGDGSTTFNVPPKAGRVSVMMESAPTLLTATYFGGNSTLIGATGGVEAHALVKAEVPPLSFSGTTGNDSPDHTHQSIGYDGGSANAGGGFGGLNSGLNETTSGASVRHQHPFSGTTDGGSGAHVNVQPTIVCNYIIRIL